MSSHSGQESRLLTSALAYRKEVHSIAISPRTSFSISRSSYVLSGWSSPLVAVTLIPVRDLDVPRRDCRARRPLGRQPSCP